MSQLALFLFGPPRIQREGSAVEIDRRKAVALLAYLAITQRPQSRETLATLFWPDYAQSQANAYLRHSLWTLNHTLGKQLLLIDRYTVGLHPQAKLWVDINEFQRQWLLCQTHDHAIDAVCPACIPLLSAAVALYQGDFMGGFLLEKSTNFEEWHRLQAEYLRHIQIIALERLVQILSPEPNQLQQAISYGRRWVALDPLNEGAHQRLMALYISSGQRSLALRQYHECVQILDQELGATPQRETTRLYESLQQNLWLAPTAVGCANGLAITTGRSAISIPRVAEPAFPEESSLPPHNLPAQVTPFVGREVELVQLGLRLRDPTCRLLTLVGPGGMGKTRLAVEAASLTMQTLATDPLAPPKFKDGVYFVTLADVSASESLPLALAAILQLSLYHPHQASKQQLFAYLADKALLLVLDNFEHLLAQADFVAKLLQAAPKLNIMITSHQRLNVPGEWIFEVPGLPYPAGSQFDNAEEYSAVQLFVQSARRVNGSFALTTQELPAVVRICQQVEGMPLALELAASWMRVLSASEVADEIEQNLTILTTSLPSVPERQRSLLAIFEHAWERLAGLEQEVFEQLTVFRGGFRRDAAAAVAAANLPILLALLDKSMLRKDSSGRFQVYELLRQFAATRLAAKATSAALIRDRHCTHYLIFLQQQGERLIGKTQGAAVAEILVELENVRAAWLWAAQTGKTTALQTALTTLVPLYEICGWLHKDEAIPLSLALLVGIATIQLAAGEVARAALLAGVVIEHAASDQATRATAIQLMRKLTTQLSAESLATIHQTVATGQFADVVAAALSGAIHGASHLLLG